MNIGSSATSVVNIFNQIPNKKDINKGIAQNLPKSIAPKPMLGSQGPQMPGSMMPPSQLPPQRIFHPPIFPHNPDMQPAQSLFSSGFGADMNEGLSEN
jgi:hypothetical protein